MNLPKENVMDTPLTLSARELSALSRDLPESFWLKTASNDESPLLFTQMLRVLPGRRIVGRAEVNGQTVLAKLFLGRMTGRYAARERQGVGFLGEAGVRTPELLFERELDNGHLMAFAFLEDAQSLARQWQAQPTPALLTDVVDVLAQMHNAGVVQNDIHLDNFLCSDHQVYCIDGGSVQQKSPSQVDRANSLRNLATFFAQFYPRFDVMIPELLDRYVAQRQWQNSSDISEQVMVQLSAERERRKRIYINKAFRECTRYYCESDFSRLLICDRRELTDEMRGILDDPDQAIRSGALLKDGNTATVARVDTQRGPIVIKRYNIKDAAHRARRAVSSTRAWRSWTNAHLLEFLGVPALRPVALIEDRFGPLRSKAYFISELIEGPDVLDHCASEADSDTHESVAHEIAQALTCLADANVTHGDLKATNFLVSSQGLALIDLDSMKEHQNRKSFTRAFSRDLQRLLRNWEKNPAVAAVLRHHLEPLAAKLNISLG